MVAVLLHQGVVNMPRAKLSFINARSCSVTQIPGFGLKDYAFKRVVSFRPFVLTMIHALCGPRHLVLKPVALGQNNLSLRPNEILCQSAVVDLLDCLASCVFP